MNTQQNQVPQNAEKLKEIPKWTRRYAENRTLTILVFMVMIVLFSVFFGGLLGFLLPLAVGGFWKGKIILGCVGTAGLVAVLAATGIGMFIFIRKFGNKNKGLIDRIIDQRVYGKEGIASMPIPKLTKKRKVFDVVFGIVYMICLLGSMELGMLGYIPVKYFLPITALFVVPFGVYQYFIMRPRLGPVLLIFPILYAIHAILILAGVPIYFKGTFAVPLNMLLPIAYNLLALIIGHIYSRYALKKLKTAVHLQEDTNESTK